MSSYIESTNLKCSHVIVADHILIEVVVYSDIFQYLLSL